MVHREVYYGKPYKQRIMMANLCPSTFLDKNINIAVSLILQIMRKNIHLAVILQNDVAGNKALNTKYHVRFSECYTDILDYFHPMPGTENNGNRTGWRQLERTNIPKSNKQVIKL